MPNTYIGIYRIVNPVGKIYIGQTWDSYRRFSRYKSYSCTTQNKIHNSLIKYGWENHIFEIIHELPKDINQSILDDYEILYIQQYKNCGFELLNIREGGKGGKLSEETKQKLRYKLGPLNKERAKTIEGKMHQSKGGKQGLGRKNTTDSIQRMRDSRPNSMIIECTDADNKLIGIYMSQADAARKLNISQATISASLKDNRKSRKGYRFKKLKK